MLKEGKRRKSKGFRFFPYFNRESFFFFAKHERQKNKEKNVLEKQKAKEEEK
jgi:hypothetical protein